MKKSAKPDALVKRVALLRYAMFTLEGGEVTTSPVRAVPQFLSY